MNKYLSISELSKILNLIDPQKKKPRNYVLRYWEKEFKQIRPKKINNRRYYSNKQVELAKMINYLLKNKGMTISGVKNVLNLKINKLDDYNSDSLKANYYKANIINKSRKLLEKVKKIKRYGKKNTFKS